MANNRLYIRCPVDGATRFLAKYYPSRYEADPEWSGNATQFFERLNEFFETHTHAHDGDPNFGVRKDGRCPWLLVTEVDIGDERCELKRDILRVVTDALSDARNKI